MGHADMFSLVPHYAISLVQVVKLLQVSPTKCVCIKHSLCLPNILELNHNNSNCCQHMTNLINDENRDLFEDQYVFRT
jgi:hypothetical protein